mmetsp:Transcript_27841/g.59531  ORF Transcript_27841/g.59531 Transcript_27841/m.59531 type:complete len:238 (+) Transcript_27841:1454-2167(+)
MNPRVSSVLNSLLYRQSLVVCPGIRQVGIAVQDTRPDNRSAGLGCYGNSESTKVCPASLLDVVQVKENCQNARPLGPFEVEGNKVVVVAIELVFFVLQQLPVFRVRVGNAGDILDAAKDLLVGLVLEALLEAPSVVRGARTAHQGIEGAVEIFFPHVRASLVSPVGPQPNQVLALFLGRHVFQGDHPRPVGGRRQNRGFEPLDVVVLRRQAREHLVEVTGAPRLGTVLVVGTPVLEG